MKKSTFILFFVCMALCRLVLSAQNTPPAYIIFQPDNRTTNLTAEDINKIWLAIETLAATSGTVMPRDAFMEMTNSIGLLPTGSNLRTDYNIRNKISRLSTSGLLFTRITRWGNHFNVSMEKATIPNFQLTRATLPLSAKINTTEQLLDKLPSLMDELGLVEKVLRPLDKPLQLVMPPTADKPLQTFCADLQKHLSAGGIKTIVGAPKDNSKDRILLTIDFDKFESNSQTLDIPMQKRQLLKTTINLSGRISMTSGDETTIFNFSKSDSQTGKPDNTHSNVNTFLDNVAHGSALQIIQKLNAKQPAP